MGDYEKAAPWQEQSIKGCKKFLERVWALQDILNYDEEYSDDLKSSVHKTIKKVSNDIENLKFNTAIAAMMTLLNEIYAKKSVTKGELKTFITLLNPFAPHMTEEMNELMGYDIPLSSTEWVSYDEQMCIDETVEIVAQINGKVKCKAVINKDASKEEVIELIKSDEKIIEAVKDKNIIKEIYVPGKLVNLVVK